MNIEINNKDKINIIIKAKIKKEELEKEINLQAKELSKTINIDGFRKGNIPISIVKQRYNEDLIKDAKSKLIQNAMNEGSKQANIDPEKIVGSPTFKELNMENNGDMKLELIISLYPIVPTIEYNKIIPTYKLEEIKDVDVQKKIDEFIRKQSPLIELKEDRVLQNGDFSIINFIAKINEEEIKDGNIKDYELEIGSNKFIPGFEEQLIGMKIGETKNILLAFPKEHPNKELQEKDATFIVTLNKIMIKEIPIFNDELAKKLFPNNSDSTKETIESNIRHLMKEESIVSLYKKELKDKILQNILENFSFDLPLNILNEEMDFLIENRIHNMKENERKKYKKDGEELLKLKAEIEIQAKERVLIDFVLNSLYQKENIKISDKEVKDIIAYEAMINGKKPEIEYKYLKDNNLLDIITNEVMRDSLFYKILGIKK